ncbi:dephospho-CoA kinase [Candidatus Woesearchaeota archaeon]|nr:dephospho-CoA kinase [Candidatus Woesearchaeota archaeon]
MCVVGVTGGIGAGKSTVAALLAARGARVLDADEIVRELYAGGEVCERVLARFGPEVMAGDGSVDRARLAARVFPDEESRRVLEEIVHPVVRGVVEESLAEWRAAGFAGLAVVDAALLVEARPPYPVDFLLVVEAEASIRLQRLEDRGMSRAEALQRMEAQAEDAERASRADHVLANHGSVEDLAAGVEEFLRKLRRDEKAI